MNVIEMTRELGKLIQQDDRYVAYNLAVTANDDDAELQNIIGEFNLKRLALNEELGKADKNTDYVKELDSEIKEMYEEIMSNKNMTVFNSAKQSFEQLISEVTQIINMCANGADPDTCQPSMGCGGSCSSCAGCG